MKFLYALLVGFCLSFTAQAVMLRDFTGDASMTEVDTGKELFRLTDANGDVDDATIFLLNLETPATLSSFGIYDPLDLSQTVEIFNVGTSPVTSATLSWDIGTGVVTNVATGDFATINYNSFGFYDGSFFSQAALNAGGPDQLFVFEVGAAAHPSLLGGNLAFVWADTSVGTFSEQTDFALVTASDIATTGNVPEPVPIALIGIGLIGMGFIRKVA